MQWYQNFVEAIEHRGKEYKDKTAIAYLHEDGSRTNTSYEEIVGGCRKVKELFGTLGIVPGDRVVIVSPHSPQAVLAALGGAYANVTTVLVDAALPDSEINRLIAFADVRALFTTEALYERIGEEVKHEIPCIQLCKKENEYILFGDSVDTVKRPKTVDPEPDVIAILFSSGTTAQMKGIKITYKSILCAKDYLVAYTNLDSSASFLNVLPVNHIAGYSAVISCFLCGAEVGFISEMSAEKLLYGMLNYNPTNFIMVPKVYEVMKNKIQEAISKKPKLVKWYANIAMKLCGTIRRKTGIKIRALTKPIWKAALGKNMKICGCGTSPCSEELMQFYLNLGIDFVNVYGATETGFPITATNCNDKYPVNGTGNITQFSEIEIKIQGKDAENIGEIRVKTPLIMKGYFKDDVLTEQSFDEEGFFKTGDLGYVDANGSLYVTGRMKESIVLHNGKKVSPTDIEKYYLSQLSAVEIACCGCQKEGKSYDEIYMFVQTAGKTEQEVQEAVAALWKLSEQATLLYKLDHVLCIDKIPMTTVGKVKRFELQKYAKEDKSVMRVESQDERLENNTESRIIQLLQQITNRDVKIMLEDRIKEDLGLDSLNLFELQTEVENQFHVRIRIDVWDEYTVYNLIEYIEKKSNHVADNEDSELYLRNRTEKDFRRIKKLEWVLDTSCKVKYKGLENLMEEPCIFIANHSSHLDIMCVYKAVIQRYGYEKVRKVCCLAAKELVEHKAMKKIFYTLGAIPVERRGNATKSLFTLNKYMREDGYSVVIFPEGTRTRTGKIGRFTNGVASIAIANNVPVIPIGIKGTFEIWPAKRNRPHLSIPRKTVNVCVGEPMYPNGLEVKAFTRLLKEEVVELCEDAE